ncbi:uncharacterized protein LOC121508572 [Cheilinus undulatus]|uniref:uncharacterized protein LOC121508572 n=1 Tax=Cheilinus undulatus TaxID=241271 RepID=UPI001BD53C69|nr:uncharacterized protein LOC121508572 [Cheilinus undulatus]XP_041641443.1 uncharacterized protein LOC121508572 [Cheilinus undulatus]XP_041641444.1 uncharacterized protein LOC121508572 [Cheilinus undulatus]XP_041641445.1 uncharacterized protein LOC121508572 [Cheilinus undulatus]XP_041641446.1 uncharacterized protein LOC121508572 [Cheilinus undulatus]XP_041641447.1 uncharacterized protein LOC121508572 [Cheilinus undulatus]XP_041641448.1 uncharacterized protein LOC121508572 [Cheilinus undulatu
MVVALADGRMDSPGHSSQYCTYTTMELDTMDIISVVTVDKRQTDRKSVAMEKFAFIQTFDRFMEEIKIKETVTDAHVQIAALMDPQKGRYKDYGVIHSLNIWHAAKSLAKRLHAAGMISGQSAILVWLKDIVNHFWFVCQKAKDRDEFMGIWHGVLQHVRGRHEWSYVRCLHGPLDVGQLQKEYMTSKSAAHVALSHIVLNKRWLKNVEKWLTFRSTSDLESFQNHILMYAGKRYAFSPPVYEARTLLAALDYNHHIHRPVHVNKRGEVSQKKSTQQEV